MKEIKNILFFIKYIKPQWKTLLTVIVLTIVATGIGLYLPIINSNLVDKGILAKNFDYVLNISIIYTLAYVVKGFIGLLISSLTAIMNSKIRFKMNQDVFKEIERFKLSYFQNNDPTMIYNNITTDINNVSKLFDGNLLNVFTQMLYLIGGITCVFVINYKLALVAIAIIPIKYFSINFFSKKNKVLTKEYLSIHTDYARWFQDTIQGIRDIKVFNLYEKKENEFSKVKTKFIKYERMFSIISSAKEEFDNFITQFIIIIIYILGTFFIIKNELTYGTIVAFLTYLVYVSTPISYLTNIKFIFSGIIPSAKRLKEIFETEKEIYNQKIPVSVLKEDSIIELKGVSYSFADKKLIDDMGDLTEIQGITYRASGQLIHNNDRTLIENLDSLPFPVRSRIRANKTVGIQTSRGCPGQCIFCCAAKLSGGRYRMRSAENVVSEIEEIYNRGGRKIFFQDDTVTVHIRRLRKIMSMLIEKKLDLVWMAESRVDVISKDSAILKEMKESGCIALQFGVESGSQEILDKLKKNITINQIYTSVRAAIDVGINVMCTFLIGHPFDTPKTILETFEFAKTLIDLGATTALSIVCPYPGTAIREEKEKYKVKIYPTDFKDYNTLTPIMDIECMERKEIKRYFYSLGKQLQEYEREKQNY